MRRPRRLTLQRAGKAEILTEESRRRAARVACRHRPGDGGSSGSEGERMARWIDGRSLLRLGVLSLACLLLALGAVALATGCGGDESRTSTAARRVVKVKHEPSDPWTYARARFKELCAGCHTLADAGATGRRFNLDHSTGVEETHVRYVIASGEPGMPAWGGVLSGREYEELVAYVVTVARREEGDDYWHRQITLRGEGEEWTPADTRRLELYAQKLRKRNNELLVRKVKRAEERRARERR
jgi:mono/diheme cytochrome c family protein